MNIQIEFDEKLFQHLQSCFWAEEKIANFKKVDNATIEITCPKSEDNEVIRELMSYSFDSARDIYTEKPEEIKLNTQLKPLIESSINKIQKEMYIHVDTIDFKEENEHIFTLRSNQTKLGVLFNMFFWAGMEYQKSLELQEPS